MSSGTATKASVGFMLVGSSTIPDRTRIPQGLSTIFNTDSTYSVGNNSPYQMWSQEISSIRNLSQNWDGYDAKPVYDEVLDQALQLLMMLSGDHISHITDIYPNTHGTITIEWEKSPLEKLVLEIGVDNYSYFFKFPSRSTILKDGDNLYLDSKEIIAHLKTLFWENECVGFY